MDRKHDRDVGVTIDERAQRAQVAGHDLAGILPAMGGQHDQAPAVQVIEQAREVGRGLAFLQDRLERVDHRVAGQQDTVARDAFADQRLQVAAGGREMQVHQLRDHPSVDFLGKRAVAIAGAQACFDMADGDAGVAGGHGAGHGGGGVALDENEVGPFAGDDGAEAFDHPAEHVGGALGGGHDFQVVVDPDLQLPDERTQQVGVLGRGDVDAAQVGIATLERMDHRRELDDLRSGSEKGEDSGHRRR